MSIWKRLAAVVTALGLLVLPGSETIGNAQPNRAGATLHIAVVAPFTGGQAFDGKLFFPAVAAACKYINASGGILGHRCQVDSVDTKSDAADALPAFRQEMATAGNVVAVEGLDSTAGPTLIPLINHDHIIAFGEAGESNFFDSSRYPYLFNLQPPDEETGFGLALAAAKKGFRHPALVFTATPDTRPVTQGVLSALKSLGISPSVNLQIAPGQTSYGTEVARLVGAKPDVFITELDPQTAGTFFANLETRLGKLTIPFITDNTAANSQWHQAVVHGVPNAEIMKEASIVIPASASPNNLSYRALARGFASYHPGEPLTPAWTAPLFDSVNLMALAMIEAKSISPSAITRDMFRIGAGTHGAKVVHSFTEGKAAILHGRAIHLIGAAGGMHWNKYRSRVLPVTIQRFTASGDTVPTGVVIGQQAFTKALHP